MLPNIDEPEVATLLLDPENPRLPSFIGREQPEIFKFLALSSSIDELIKTIGSNGYFASEPLIGVSVNGQTTIVEGNRRLTALKLLGGEVFENVPHKIAAAVEQAEYRPANVPVALYQTREEILNYLGNKHIAGVKPWGALAKARYVKQLFQREAQIADYQEKIRTVARRIGSRSDYIGRTLKALEAYELAEGRGFFGLDNVNEESVKFSLLSTALDYAEIKNFVYENPEENTADRIIKEDCLRDLFSWMFEKKEGEHRTRLGESRNLNTLSRVVASEEGLRQFRLGTPLEQAYKLTDGLDEEFDVLLNNILSELRSANSIVADVTYTEDREDSTTSIVRHSRQLSRAFKPDDED